LWPRFFFTLYPFFTSTTMPPNARMPAVLFEEPPEHEEPVFTEIIDSKQADMTAMLDNQADTSGLSNVNGDNEDWTDVKHSERKKRDRILDDGVLIGLMKKSDYPGLKRLFTNLFIMASTASAIHKLDVFPLDMAKLTLEKMAIFIPLYFFYGFQFQCFAFAGQHEFLHRNAFKTKSINDWCLFFVGVFCFELGEHERVMHKQHHTFTNHIDKDPELTSWYSRETLENPAFRNLPATRWDYLMGVFDIFTSFKARAGRIICSAMGIAVDYSGWSWSLNDWTYSKESGIMQKLQRTAWMQLSFYFTVAMTICQTRQGLAAVLFYWIVPVLIGYPVVNFFRNLEHADCEVSKISNCLRNTRSVRSNIIVRCLLWDTNYHAEHHCYPMVPFFNLHKLNELMYEHVIHSEKDHFTTQVYAALEVGGWIDTQARDMSTAKPKAE
jgi:fatty acid desaturase